MSLVKSEDYRGNILIVDDTPANLRLLSSILSENGYNARPVPSGQLALNAVQAETPDLIMLDIRMPGMDGYEVCNRLKASEQSRYIPVIFISALDAVEDKVRAFQIGGVDYITKPFQAEEILARIETHLALQRLQSSLQIANQKMARELLLAGEVQTSLLHYRRPSLPGWQISEILKPAKDTSGDFFDINPLPDGKIAITIADVVDKGVAAALYMALSLGLIRTFTMEYPNQPARILSAVNRHILENTSSNQFVTVFYGVLDLDSGKLVYSNAGHCPPYLLHQDGTEQPLTHPKTRKPLGLFDNEVWEQASIQFSHQDVLVLYTDGITESFNKQDILFGVERLLQSVKNNLQRAPQAILEAILKDLYEFSDGIPQEDDIALIVLKQL